MFWNWFGEHGSPLEDDIDGGLFRLNSMLLD